MRGSYYNSSFGTVNVGDFDLLVGGLAGVASEVTVDVGMLSVVTLYSAVVAGSCMPVMSFICYPCGGIEGVLVTVGESAYVTFAVVVAVDVITLILVLKVTSADRSKVVLAAIYHAVVSPLVFVLTNLEGTYVTEAVLVIVKVRCIFINHLVITV